MCMVVTRMNPEERETAWKVMERFRGAWRTPFQHATPVGNVLAAAGEVDRQPLLSATGKHEGDIVRGGVIHCYKDRGVAELVAYPWDCRKVFEVRGTDPVCENLNEIGYKSIEFIDGLDD